MRGCIIIHVVVVGTHAHLSFHSNFEFDARIVDSINEKIKSSAVAVDCIPLH